MKNLYLLLLLLGIQTMAFSQWDSSVIGFDRPLNIWDMDAVDENTAWAITTDGTYSGDVWSINTSSTFATTSDGGVSWTVGELPLANSSWSGWKVSAIDANTAWVAASNPFALGAAIFKTTDAGVTWTQQTIFSETSFCSVVHFWDANSGVAIGEVVNDEFEIFTTTDGGENWIQVSGENIPDPTDPAEFVATSVCAVVGDHIWFGTRYSRVFHSTDRGLNWTASTTPISAITSNPWVEGIAFQDELVGIAHSADYGSQPYQHLIAYTEDGGATWIEQIVTDRDFSIFHAQYVEDALIKTSRATNGDGPFTTSYSFDHGINWTDIETSTPISDFEFIDNETAWGGKFKNNDDSTAMYKYTGAVISGISSPKTLDVEWSVSPNPTADFLFLNIKANQGNITALELYTTDGQLILNRKFSKGAVQNEMIDLSKFPQGLYYVVLKNELGEVATKEVVKK